MILLNLVGQCEVHTKFNRMSIDKVNRINVDNYGKPVVRSSTYSLKGNSGTGLTSFQKKE